MDIFPLYQLQHNSTTVSKLKLTKKLFKNSEVSMKLVLWSKVLTNSTMSSGTFTASSKETTAVLTFSPTTRKPLK